MEELALAADVSVDTIRYYQKQRLLPPPERDGRLGWYGGDHLERLGRIRALQRRGFSLALIRRALDGELDPADESLAAAVTGAGTGDEPAPEDPDSFSLAALADRAGVPATLLEMLVHEGILVPRRVGGKERFTEADAGAVAAGLRVLELGFPLPELIGLARRHDAATREFATRAVALFDQHVREPLRTAGLPDEERSRRLVAAFEALLPAVTTMVAHHFRRTLLAVATEHLEKAGEPPEVAELAGAGLA